MGKGHCARPGDSRWRQCVRTGVGLRGDITHPCLPGQPELIALGELREALW